MHSDKKTRVVKRYQNRKLYDTQSSCYVTLEDIANFIRNGEDVVVIDNKNQEDLTTITFSQIIFEQEKKKKHHLPLQALRNIIQSGGEQLVDFFQKSIHSVSHISTVKDEAEKVIDKIRDEIEDGGAFVKDYLAKAHNSIDDFSKKFEEKVKSLGRVTNIPQLRSEIRSLQQKVVDLERKIKRFEK